MDTSFYYFFSSTPQVLGGILALFGVFVVFKIQALSNLLMSIAKDVVQVLDNFILPGIDVDINNIYKAIDENNLKDLDKIIAGLGDGFFATELNPTIPREKLGTYGINKVRFRVLFRIYEDLSNTTINSTIFGAAVITICLVTLPFIHILKCYPYLLYTLSIIILICTSYIFVRLIFVLKKALK